MATDIEIKVEADGTLTVETPQIPGEYHLQADEMLTWIQEQLGGETVKVRRKPEHTHAVGKRTIRHSH